MNLWLRFKDEKLYKIIARFSPDSIPDMVQRFQEALGAGENKSRVITNHEGKETRQTIYSWNYPHSVMHLVGISSVSEFATVSLITKHEKK